MDDEGTRVGIDKWGEKVIISSFFSKIYIDEEMQRLSDEYDIWECDGEMRLSTLGNADKEDLVAQILLLVRATRNNPPSLVGVKKKELEMVAKRRGNHWYIEGLIVARFLREKWIEGDLVVFPTEELLQNQRIPKRKF